MPALILPLIEAVTHWPERGALVGLDLGTKTIGVAVSNADRRLATGVETIQRTAFKADAARLLALAGERAAVGFVLGLPINMHPDILVVRHHASGAVELLARKVDGSVINAGDGSHGAADRARSARRR